MKKSVSLLLSAALLLGLLSACREDAVFVPSPEPSAAQDGPAALEVVEAALDASGADGEELEYMAVEYGEEFLAEYLDNAYDLQDPWEDGVVVRGLGASAFEIAVVRMEDEGAAVRAATAFMNYISTRQGDFAGYAPDQADMVAQGEILQVGSYAALFICPDPGGASAAVEAALKGEPLPGPSQAGGEPEADPTEAALPGYDPDYPDRVEFVPPNKDDMSLYDTTAIRAAWEAGDPAELSDYDRDVYDAAREVLDKALKDGMGDFEKERAIYSWIVNHVDYDWTHQDILATTPRESFTPYGGLVNRTAVCLGYATTFQLLCDLAGVECITVVGAAFRSEEDHGWNMVRLDGDWYCVDVTWDANYREQGVGRGRERDWNYFNVTSDIMAASNHQWDYANTPEAVTQGNGRG